MGQQSGRAQSSCTWIDIWLLPCSPCSLFCILFAYYLRIILKSFSHVSQQSGYWSSRKLDNEWWDIKYACVSNFLWTNIHLSNLCYHRLGAKDRNNKNKTNKQTNKQKKKQWTLNSSRHGSKSTIYASRLQSSIYARLQSSIYASLIMHVCNTECPALLHKLLERTVACV